MTKIDMRYCSVRQVLLLLIGILWVGMLSAQKQPPAATDYLVNDYARLLTPQQVEQLGNKLRNYIGETSTQIVVVTEKSLQGADIASYTVDLAHNWGIGTADDDNGILIYVASDDRKISIQTGYGAEGFLPDAYAYRIINNVMGPAFRQGDYYGGLNQATDIIMDLGRGEYEGTGLPVGERKGIPFIYIVLLALLLFWLLARLNRHDDDDDGGYYRGGRYDMEPRMPRRSRGGWIFIPGGGWSGGGGGGWSGGGGGGGFGGFGGGGFGGFGGGGFGGGGAVGGW